MKLLSSIFNFDFLLENLGCEESPGKTLNDEHHSSDEEESHAAMISNATRSSPLTLSRLLSRSRSSLPLVDDAVKQEKPTEQPIVLPKDYNPVAALMQVEIFHAFINKVSHDVYKSKMTSGDNISNQKQILALARMKEQQILGCLIVEIFLAEKFRAIWKVEKISFTHRLNACINVIKTLPSVMPKCVQSAVMLLLRIDAIPKSYGIDFVKSDYCDSKLFNFFKLCRDNFFF